MNKEGVCNIHHSDLAKETAMILYGYPSPAIFEIDAKFPNHGLFSRLGGCVVTGDDDLDDDVQVCGECRREAEQYLNMR
jgi:hypothetical protein